VEPGNPEVIKIIDQRYLPFEFVFRELKSFSEARQAIDEMWVRGAPLIGVTAAFGMYLAALEWSGKANIHDYLYDKAGEMKKVRPTAVNLSNGVDLILQACKDENEPGKIREKSFNAANAFMRKEIDNCHRIGIHGLQIIRELYQQKQDTINLLTHCNAGWLACVDYGTATAPIYLAREEGIPVHIYVDETRPRNQGARLTAWELAGQGIEHTVIPDNTGGLLMQKGMIDAVIVGSDRCSITGDVANKIGTYLKALAAHDNQLPFYVALPVSTIDTDMQDAVKELEIEQRSQDEVRYIEGWDGKKQSRLKVVPDKSRVLNYGFDITPAEFVTALITEKGICAADEKDIRQLLDSSGGTNPDD
jgi:methylthioribose-1-phosphate isomerase